MSGHQQTIYTIHESQLNNNGHNSANSNGSGGGGHRGSQSNADLLIDTSSIPLVGQSPLPLIPSHHQHLQPTLAGDSGAPVTSQPGAGSSRVAPESQNVVYSVHPVFNMLDGHDRLLVRQRAECTGTCCGFESVNTYTVRAKDGSPVLKAIESSNCCERCCFEGNREYNLSLVHGDEVVARVRKPYRVSRFCCYSNAVRIESPEDNPIGHIKQIFTLFGHPRYAIFDCQQSPKTPSFYVESTSCRFCFMPCLCTSVCTNREFKIVSVETKEQVGTIGRHLSTGNDSNDRRGSPIGNNTGQQAGEGSESPQAQQQDHNNDDALEQNDHDQEDPEDPFKANQRRQEQLFGVQFEPNLEARHKVLLLSACFMMDFFYFESDRRRRKLARC